MYDECLRSNVLPADGFLSFALVMLMRVDMLLFWIISVRLIFSSSVFDMVLSLKVCFGFEPTVLVVVFEPTNCYCFCVFKITHTTYHQIPYSWRMVLYPVKAVVKIL